MHLHATAHDTRAPDAEARFAPYRPALSGLAFNVLGSLDAAAATLDDTESRLAQLDPPTADLGDWLALTTARLCLEALRVRAMGPPLPDWALPDFVVTVNARYGARQNALLGGSVGTARLVALSALSPEGRAALVLHDTYGTPYDDLGAKVLWCSSADAERLVREARAVVDHLDEPDANLAEQHHVVHAFCRVAARGDHRALRGLLHDGARLQNDSGDHTLSGTIVDADLIVQRAIMLSRATPRFHPALVNGAAGLAISKRGHLVAVASFTVVDGLVARIDTLADHSRISRYDIPGLELEDVPSAA